MVSVIQVLPGKCSQKKKTLDNLRKLDYAMSNFMSQFFQPEGDFLIALTHVVYYKANAKMYLIYVET